MTVTLIKIYREEGGSIFRRNVDFHLQKLHNIS